MNWIDIACIVFACVTANHLGLVSAIEEVIGRKIPIVNCVKCFSFWCVLGYGIYTRAGVVTVCAVSFLASYTAIWLELLEGFVDTIYTKCYDKIYSTAEDDAVAADECQRDTTGSVS